MGVGLWVIAAATLIWGIGSRVLAPPPNGRIDLSTAHDPSRRRPLRVAAALLALALIVSLAAATERAAAAKPLATGFADYLYGTGDSDLWLNRTEDANAGIIRVNLYWSSVAANKPATPRDPSDPAYNFAGIDTAIRDADQHGFDVLLTVLSAPSWAEGPNRPPLEQIRSGAWRPDAAAFGDFAHALAVRYSGGFADLPEVEYLQAWNEPNLNTYIAPQWDGKRNVSSDIYVRLLNNFYEEVKAVNPSVKVVAAGTAPYGDPPGGPNRTRPLKFYRELLCLNDKLKKGACPNGEKANFDVAAHHPINREDAPTKHALADDDVEIADFGELTKTLRKAEKLHTTGTPGRHPLFADEVWWQTDPPDRAEGVKLKTHARWTAQGLYLLWKQGASKVIFLQFRDAKYTPGESSLASYQTGVYTYADKKKPSFDAVRFPFVTDRKSKSKLLAWGKAPDSGKLVIEVKQGKKYEQAASFKVKKNKVFTETLRVRGNAKVRARMGKDKSLVWSEKG